MKLDEAERKKASSKQQALTTNLIDLLAIILSIPGFFEDTLDRQAHACLRRVVALPKGTACRPVGRRWRAAWQPVKKQNFSLPKIDEQRSNDDGRVSPVFNWALEVGEADA
eukprot:scaffold14896_cov111-Isochrysis_galbana.AAC.9